MITLPGAAEFLLYREPVDMRKSFDGLSGIVREKLGREPTDGTLFLFINRRRDRIKLSYWDSDGLPSRTILQNTSGSSIRRCNGPRSAPLAGDPAIVS